MKHPRRAVAMAAAGGFLYCFGGRDRQNVISNSKGYDIANNRWEDIPPIPSPRYRSCAVTVDDKMYVISGVHQGSRSNVVEVFISKHRLCLL